MLSITIFLVFGHESPLELFPFLLDLFKPTSHMHIGGGALRLILRAALNQVVPRGVTQLNEGLLHPLDFSTHVFLIVCDSVRDF